MQKIFAYKFLIIGGLALLLLIPLSMIKHVIYERESYQKEVVRDISESWTGSQKVTGAIFVAPYKEVVRRKEDVVENGKKVTVVKDTTVQRYKYFLPEEVAIDGNVAVEERYRGIYTVPVYRADLKLKGYFSIPKSLGLTENMENITWQRPYIIFGVKDIRGINRSVQLYINQKEVPLLPGTGVTFMEQGIHAMLQPEYNATQRLAFDMALELQGMEQLSFTPTGRFTKVNISSPWPHPSFMGRFLPKSREVSEEGFTASWETTFFASNMLQSLQNCAQNNACYEFDETTFGVSLHEGVDVYQQAERSVKYALLFVGLTFVVFFLFEILKGLSIHAIQYGLVGAALALFYLLLISLSEHIAFGAAYALASLACIGLIGFYVSFVLRSLTRGLVFGGTLAGLYGSLYMLIQSEDYALLLGSALLFGLLTFIMVMTRRVDWYSIEATGQQVSQVSAAKKPEKREK